MNLNNAYAILQDNAFTVQVRFFGGGGAVTAGKTYTYLCDIAGIQVGDHALVMVDAGDLSLPKAVQVVSVDKEIDADLLGAIDYKWIVQKIDYADYERKMEEANELNEKIVKLKRDSARAQLKAALVNALGLENEEALNTIKKG